MNAYLWSWSREQLRFLPPRHIVSAAYTCAWANAVQWYLCSFCLSLSYTAMSQCRTAVARPAKSASTAYLRISATEETASPVCTKRPFVTPGAVCAELRLNPLLELTINAGSKRQLLAVDGWPRDCNIWYTNGCVFLFLFIFILIVLSLW